MTRNNTPAGIPSSFNVVESFQRWSKHFVAFDIREEREHLLRLDEYIEWYTAGGFPDKPEGPNQFQDKPPPNPAGCGSGVLARAGRRPPRAPRNTLSSRPAAIRPHIGANGPRKRIASVLL